MIPKARIQEKKIVDSPVLEGDSFEYWDTELDSWSIGTSYAYRTGLVKLFSRMDETTQTYYEAYKEALDSGDSMKVNLLVNRVKSELNKMNSEYSSSYTRKSYNAYLSFMRSLFRDGVEFDSDSLNRWVKERIRPNDIQSIPRIPKESIRNYIEIIKMYSRTEESIYRDIALLHVLKDSGLSRSDVVRLNVGDVMPVLGLEDRNDKFIMIEAIREKEGTKMYPCLGYESIEAIEDWIEARQKTRRKLTTIKGKFENGKDTRKRKWMNIEGETITEDTPLFVYTQNTRENKKGDRLFEGGVSGIFTKINNKIDDKRDRYSPHSLRKYNWNTLEDARIPINYAKYLQGRTISDSSSAYTLFANERNYEEDKQKLMDAFKEAYEHLSIEEEYVTQEDLEKSSKKVNELESTVEHLENKIDEMQKGVWTHLDALRGNKELGREEAELLKTVGVVENVDDFLEEVTSDDPIEEILNDPKLKKQLLKRLLEETENS